MIPGLKIHDEPPWGDKPRSSAILQSMNQTMEAQIAEAEHQLRNAMLHSDLVALDRLLSSELIFTNHLGQVLGKEDDLGAHRSGALRIEKLEPSELQIRPGGPIAIVSVRVQLSGTYNNHPAGGDFRFTRVWQRSPEGKWQVIAAHSGLITVQDP